MASADDVDEDVLSMSSRRRRLSLQRSGHRTSGFKSRRTTLRLSRNRLEVQRTALATGATGLDDSMIYASTPRRVASARMTPRPTLSRRSPETGHPAAGIRCTGQCTIRRDYVNVALRDPAGIFLLLARRARSHRTRLARRLDTCERHDRRSCDRRTATSRLSRGSRHR